MSGNDGFDYEGIGALIGLNRDLAATQANATRTIHKANAEIEKGNVEIRRLRAELAKFQTALHVEKAHSAGLSAQAIGLRDELRRIDPQNGLLKSTGLKYSNGKDQIAINRTYDLAFDTKAQEMGLSDPKSYRHNAS